MRKMYYRLERMTDSELLNVWESLRQYNPTEYYSRADNITMDTWAESVYSELITRGLPTS